MWTIILVAIIALIIIISKSVYDGDFTKGDHFHNFMMTICCLLLTGIITMFTFLMVLLGSCVIGSKDDVSTKLVNTENYYLEEIVDDKYISISSNVYNYATNENKIIHFREIKADGNTTIKVYKDIYTEEEKPMIFIDYYVVGGTFFLDNFTLCNWLNEYEEVSFYIPKDSIATFAVEIK